MKKKETTQNLLEVGAPDNYVQIFQKGGVPYIRYPFAAKEYRFDNPEEYVRAQVYVELIEKYRYAPANIKIEEYPPVREGSRPADLVIYHPEGFPFIVVEVKRESASSDEIQRGIRELFGNSNLFGVRWALFDCRKERRAYFSLTNFSINREPDLRKEDIPESYGQPEKLTFGNNVGVSLTPFGTISEFQQVVKKCHDILRDNENFSPLTAFPVISRLIYTKIYDELNTPEGKYYAFQVGEDSDSLSVASKVAHLYKKASSVEPEIFSPSLGIDKPETIRHIVEILQRYTLYDSPYDVKGEAYQSYLSRVMRGEMGQYFTPREIVKPTIEILSPEEDEKIIDPCCGTGGFLTYAYKFLRKRIENRYRDEKTKIRKLYDVAHYNIFGIEVDPNVAEACIAGMLLEDDAHGHIAITDALSNWDNPIFAQKGIKKGKFKVLVTNPPFGKKSRLEEYQERFSLSQKFKTPPFEVLVLERSIELLAPGGRAGFVIPDINLTSRDVLEFLWDKAVILGVVSLPSDTFNPYGSGAKTSVIFFKKKERPAEETSQVFMASVFQLGYDATGRIKEDGHNYYEDVVAYFHKFLRREPIIPILNDKFAICILESDKLAQARENLRADSYHSGKRGDNFVPLGEVADVLRGYTASWHEYTKSGIPILKVRNLANRFISFTFERRGFVPEELYERHKEAHLKLFDILLTASAHKPEYIAKKVDIVDFLPFERCMAVGELLIVRPRPEKIDPFYLLSALRRSNVNNQFRACIKGTTAHIYPDDVAKNVFIPRLSPEKEKEIGQSLKRALQTFREFEAEFSKYTELVKKKFEKED